MRLVFGRPVVKRRIPMESLRQLASKRQALDIWAIPRTLAPPAAAATKGDGETFWQRREAEAGRGASSGGGEQGARYAAGGGVDKCPDR